MKYIILVDERPNKCEDCEFFTESLESTDEKNVLNICNKCMWGAPEHSKCPLTEVNTMFVSDKGNFNNS